MVVICTIIRSVPYQDGKGETTRFVLGEPDHPEKEIYPTINYALAQGWAINVQPFDSRRLLGRDESEQRRAMMIWKNVVNWDRERKRNANV